MAFDVDFQPPEGFQTDEFLLRQLVVADNPLDYDAVMESKEFLRLWEGTSWPEDGFTLEANLADMEKMEGRHNERHSFGYTVMNLTETECLGCVYIFPTDLSWLADSEIASVADAQWSDYDTAVYFWIRKSRLADELDRRLLDELGKWMQRAWPSRRHFIVTSEPFEQQVKMIESTDLQLKFRLTDPAEPGASLAFA